MTTVNQSDCYHTPCLGFIESQEHERTKHIMRHARWVHTLRPLRPGPTPTAVLHGIFPNALDEYPYQDLLGSHHCYYFAETLCTKFDLCLDQDAGDRQGQTTCNSRTMRGQRQKTRADPTIGPLDDGAVVTITPLLPPNPA